MMPEWNKFHMAHKNNSSVHIYKVDGSKHAEIAEKYDVHGFPTVIGIKNGIKTVFDGERTAEALERFLKLQY